MKKYVLVIIFVVMFSVVNVSANEGWWTFTSTQVSISQKDSTEKESAILMTNVHFVPEKILSFSENSQMESLSSDYLLKNLIKPMTKHGLVFSEIGTSIHQCRVAEIQKEKQAVAEIWQRCMNKVGGGFNVYTFDVNLEKPLSLNSAKIKLVKKDDSQTAFLANALRNINQ